MLIYILLPLLNIILYFFLSKKEKGRKIYLITILTVLMLLSSFRSKQIGADYSVYVNVFENISKHISSYPMEKGYLILNYLVSIFTSNYVVFSLVINSIIFSVFYKFIKDNVDEKYYVWIMSMFILNPYLYIQSTFNIIRQMLSICIILYGIKFLNEKKYIHFVLSIILASQFHSMGYIYLSLLLIKLIKWDEKKFYLISIGSLVMNILGENNVILQFLSSLLGYGKYNGYKDTMFNFPIYILFIFAVVILLIKNYKKIKTNEKEKLFLDTYIISLSLLPIFITNDIMYRVHIGLVFMSLPAIPIILKYLKDKSKKVNFIVKGGFILYYVLMFSLFIFLAMKTNNINYVPFTFFWQ